ncbi:MAG: peptidylprolyl isomerase [Candidatus Krumholzibacteria bacterium]|nr:peptidylprolyl isomerase [Candidatus Krumholzibacteria bacterium]MDH5566798.1 peptidylprolyl isomerase [Myxococcales bacterium]
MRRWLREPLLHFLLAGAALFALHGMVAGPGVAPPERIAVGEDRIRMLSQSFERTWQRPPSALELGGLIDDYVTEEVLYREALALGLDRDDLVVRRRMRQKMEFLNDELVESEPSDAVLRAYFAANAERFRVSSRVSFAQVFVGAEANGSAQARAADLLARLRAGEDPETLGAATGLPPAMASATPSEVAGFFGAAFAEALAEAPDATWSGPVASSFGLHLVRVGTRVPGRLPPFEDARRFVEREWAAEQRDETRERFYRALRGRYDIEVRMPADTPMPDVAGPP